MAASTELIVGDKMSILHYCDNGSTITDQVELYQNTRDNSDYLPVHKYYSNYKDWWYKQVEDFVDRVTFDSEFDLKLYWSVNEFKVDTANELAEKYKWNKLGNFNRWFYRVLCNWRSNIRASVLRHKKRPPVQCPCCGRFVSKITEEHLQHYKKLSELPVAFEYEGNIYQTTLTPSNDVWCWGKYSSIKLNRINKKQGKLYVKDKTKEPWPWFKSGIPQTICPFTKNMIDKITEKYIHSLPDRCSRYSSPVSWQRLVEEHPMVLIQSEVYSLDYDQSNDDLFLKDTLGRVYECGEMDLAMVLNEEVTTKYEQVFNTIDHFTPDKIDRHVLKLTAIGYGEEDIAETLSIAKKDVKKRIESFREVDGLEIALQTA